MEQNGQDHKTLAESPKQRFRWDDGLRSDAQRCARARGITVAEFIRQAVAHYVAFTEAQGFRNDQEPPTK